MEHIGAKASLKGIILIYKKNVINIARIKLYPCLHEANGSHLNLSIRILFRQLREKRIIMPREKHPYPAS